jgi:hypothetical protein
LRSKKFTPIDGQVFYRADLDNVIVVKNDSGITPSGPNNGKLGFIIFGRIFWSVTQFDAAGNANGCVGGWWDFQQLKGGPDACRQ